MLAQGFQDAETYVLDWVLWREALLGFLLPHLRHIPETADLGLYAGLQYGKFTESDPEALTALWKQVSPPQHFQHYIYDGPFGFPLFDQVVSGHFLRRVIPWLNTLRRTATRTTLTTATYTAALERWMLETHIPLTESEHQILTALSRLTTPLHQSRLADELNMSISGLSQHLTALAKRHALRLNHFINLPLIGLTPYELLIHVPNQQTRRRIVKLFNQIRYTWFINPIQRHRLHCRVFIPTRNTEEFHEWLVELAKHHDLLPIEPLRTADIIQSWNLCLYTPNQGWIDDFAFQFHLLQAIFDDEYTSPLPPISSSSMTYELLEDEQKYPIALRPEDFTYFLRAADIHQITDRVTPQASKELQEAGISPTAHMVYRRRIKQLEKMKVSSVKGMFPLHLGLDSVLQIYVNESRAITEQVQKALSIFPNLNGLNFDNGYGMIFLYIPNPSAVEVVSEIRKLFSMNDIDSTIEAKPSWQSITGFELPVTLGNYDAEKREWKWERTTLPEPGLK
jgi:DNA-binding MarR family transcriptional regulator